MRFPRVTREIASRVNTRNKTFLGHVVPMMHGILKNNAGDPTTKKILKAAGIKADEFKKLYSAKTSREKRSLYGRDFSAREKFSGSFEDILTLSMNIYTSQTLALTSSDENEYVSELNRLSKLTVLDVLGEPAPSNPNKYRARCTFLKVGMCLCSCESETPPDIVIPPKPKYGVKLYKMRCIDRQGDGTDNDEILISYASVDGHGKVHVGARYWPDVKEGYYQLQEWIYPIADPDGFLSFSVEMYELEDEDKGHAVANAFTAVGAALGSIPHPGTLVAGGLLQIAGAISGLIASLNGDDWFGNFDKSFESNAELEGNVDNVWRKYFGEEFPNLRVDDDSRYRLYIKLVKGG